MVLFGFVFALRVLFFSFFMVLFGFVFRRVFVIYPSKKKKKSACRLDMKNLAFGFKIIISNKSKEFVLIVVCEFYFSLCLIG